MPFFDSILFGMNGGKTIVKIDFVCRSDDGVAQHRFFVGVVGSWTAIRKFMDV